MRTADMIKSKFFRAKDLEGVAPLTLTISDVTEELIGRGGHQDVRVFLWFHEHPKGLRLNKTSVNTLEAAYGPESDAWSGRKVRLFFDPKVEFGGRAVGGVGIMTPRGIVYAGPAAASGGWGGEAAPLAPVGAPPPPVWDAQAQVWVTRQPPAPAPRSEPPRPPAPVWNAATQQWEVVNPGTGEIAPPVHQRPQTISERVNAGHPPAAADQGWGAPPPQSAPAGQPAEFEDDADIPF
jgi:hypothetical protein